MKKRVITTIFTVAICLPMSGALSVEAAKVAVQTKSEQALHFVSEVVDQITVSCKVDNVEKPVYSGQLLSIDVPTQVDPGQIFVIKAQIVNTGNVPWFSIGSGCTDQASTFLGTTREQDRESIFHAPGVFGDTKWFGGNRIKMKTARVNPGQTAEFTFVGHAPEEAGLYREYFAPVVEGKAWIKDQAEFSFDLQVGQPEMKEEILKYTREMPISLNLLDPKFEGDKKILVDLSEQKMFLHMGDVVIKEFPVSTGKPKTPTPVGTTKIQFKQEVRVAGGYPHYIMPKFMQFRKGGYGIHALPSLGNDHGVFWREALNHIGSARSHGCIRLLPDDANFTFDWADVGTEVQVVW